MNERDWTRDPDDGYEDQYHIHDGGCTMSGFQRDSGAASDCAAYAGGGCACSQYSGITHTAGGAVAVAL